MGHNMARFLQRKRVAVLMLGLENSGKTTILYKLLTGEKILPVPTFGFNMEILPFDDIELDVMDVGGDHRIVPLWKHYLISAAALIYVVDCSDVNRMEENKNLLADIVSRPERKGVPLLVIVNKTDSLGYDLTTDDLQLRLDLQMNCKLRPYKVHMVSAETGDGLHEAFTWLCAKLGSGIATKQQKRISEELAKREKTVMNKRRRLDSLCDEFYTQDGIELRESVPGNESGIETPLATPIDVGTTDGRLFSFSDTYERMNAFFKSRAGEMGIMLSGSPRTPTSTTTSDPPEQAEVYMGADAVDTLSSDPHKPFSPRRLGSMMRLQEFIDSRNVAKAKVETRRREENVQGSSSEQESAENIPGGPSPNSKTEEFSFTRLFSFFTRNPSLASDSDEVKQSSLPSPNRVVQSRREINLNERSSSLSHLKNRNKAVAKSDSVYWKERHKKRISVDDSFEGSPAKEAARVEVEMPKEETASPAKSARPSILTVLASIRFSLGLLRRGSREDRNNSEEGLDEDTIKVGKSVFHVSHDERSDDSAAPPLVRLQPPSPTTI